MARFEPFPAIRYDLSRFDLAGVVSPPYDVIDKTLRDELAARDPHNAVHIDLPADAPERRRAGSASLGEDRYGVAARLLREWQEDGSLVSDDKPSFTIYRMGYRDDSGRDCHTTGVIGALELTPPGTDILPHEHTTPKAKSDRLDLLRATRANTSAIWGLSLAKGLTALLPTDVPPLADITDEAGIRHTVWRVDDPAVLGAISEAVAAQPVVVADGHHRYETSLAYRGERTESDGDPGPAGLTLAYLVELVEDELTVRAIHRLLNGLPEGFDLIDALSPWFEPQGAPPCSREEFATAISQVMIDTGCLCVVLPDHEELLRPRPEALAEARDLDSARLDVAVEYLPDPEVTFQHGPDNVRRAVQCGEAQAGILLRPATVAQIEATAHGGERMPPKTTFFHPKLKTGLVFRSLE